MTTRPGWINTPALGPPGEGYNQLTIGTDYLSEKAVTEGKLATAVADKLNISDDPLLQALEEMLIETRQLHQLLLFAFG